MWSVSWTCYVLIVPHGPGTNLAAALGDLWVGTNLRFLSCLVVTWASQSGWSSADNGSSEPRIGACGVGVGAWHRMRGEEEAIWGSAKNSGLIEIWTSQKRSLRWVEQKGSGSWGTARQAPGSLRLGWWLWVAALGQMASAEALWGQRQPFCIPKLVHCLVHTSDSLGSDCRHFLKAAHPLSANS